MAFFHCSLFFPCSPCLVYLLLVFFIYIARFFSLFSLLVFFIAFFHCSFFSSLAVGERLPCSFIARQRQASARPAQGEPPPKKTHPPKTRYIKFSEAFFHRVFRDVFFHHSPCFLSLRRGGRASENIKSNAGGKHLKFIYHSFFSSLTVCERLPYPRTLPQSASVTPIHPPQPLGYFGGVSDEKSKFMFIYPADRFTIFSGTRV